MSTASRRSVKLSEAAPLFDKYSLVQLLAYAYCLILDSVLDFVSPGDMTTDRIQNKIFWPAVTFLALGCLASGNRRRLTWPPHIAWLAAYLALAGASILWAFKPGISFTRFSTQTMIIISIVLPAMLAPRKIDMIRGLFFCFVFGEILNVILIIGGYSSPDLATDGTSIGYPGYFSFKGVLGEFAASVFCFHFTRYPSQVGGEHWDYLIIGLSLYLINVSMSKGSFGYVLIAVILAPIVLFIGKKMRVSPAIVLLPLPIGYFVLSKIVGNLIDRMSWYAYGNYDLSGREYIWYFVNSEIAKRPLLGWGYRSFWLVGPNSPPYTDAWGWISEMPSAHNGYLDTILDTGYIGLVLFLVFIFTTFDAIGRVADRDPPRAWLLLSIALFIALVNFLESRLDAQFGCVVGDVHSCRCRSWPILAAFRSRLGRRRADRP